MSFESSGAPEHFICPISGHLMLEPCVTPCGHMFDRTSLNESDSKIMDCPQCGQEFDTANVSPCHAIRMAIEEYQQGSKSRGTVLSSLISRWKKAKKPKKQRKERSLATVSKKSSRASMSQLNSTQVLSLGEEIMDTPRVPIWARLVPINGASPVFDVDRDKFLLGRSPNLHAHVPLPEISSRHFCLTRCRTESGLFDVILEDYSTNGTYVDGLLVGRGCRKAIFQNSTITLGSRFTIKRGLPTMPALIQWMQAVRPELQAYATPLESLASLSLEAFLHADEEDLSPLIPAPSITVVLASRDAWVQENKFPAFHLDLKNPSEYRRETIDAAQTLELRLERMQLTGDCIAASLATQFPFISRQVIDVIVAYETELGARDGILAERCLARLRKLPVL